MEINNSLLVQWDNYVQLPGGAGWERPINITFPITYSTFVNVITSKLDFKHGQNNQSWTAVTNVSLSGFKFGCADTDNGSWLTIGI